jgi:preprotein translocase subunit SecG
MHFETGDGGLARLSYSNPLSRYMWVLLQVFLWLVVVLGILQPNFRRRSRRQQFELPETTPVVSLSTNPISGDLA